jgi:Zeta toxin
MALSGGDTDRILEMIKLFKTAGYAIEVASLAVNDAISKIGIRYRYEKQIEERRRGRPVDAAYHDKVYNSIPGNLLAAFASGRVDSFTIYARNNENATILLLKHYDKETLNENYRQPITDFSIERSRLLRVREMDALKSWGMATKTLVEKNGRNPTDFLWTIRTIDVNASSELKNSFDQIVGLSGEQISG